MMKWKYMILLNTMKHCRYCRKEIVETDRFDGTLGVLVENDWVHITGRYGCDKTSSERTYATLLISFNEYYDAL
jgi:hypothetical protein